MPIYKWEGDILLVDDKIAIHERCCCDEGTYICEYVWSVTYDCDSEGSWGSVTEVSRSCIEDTGPVDSDWVIHSTTSTTCTYRKTTYGDSCDPDPQPSGDCPSITAPDAPTGEPDPEDCPCVEPGGDIYCLELRKNPCPNDYPAIKMTVSWSDAAACKDYFGETFTNGDTKYICPTTYVKQKVYNPATPTTLFWGGVWLAEERWYRPGLRLNRHYGKGHYGFLGTTVGFCGGHNAAQDMNIVGVSDYFARLDMNCDDSWSMSFSFFNVGKISGVATPSFNDAYLTGAYFGSHTIGTTTFTWSKGPGW